MIHVIIKRNEICPCLLTGITTVWCLCAWIFTARKRSLEQGNVFTPVCHSVHRGVCPTLPHRQTGGWADPPRQTPLDADPLGRPPWMQTPPRPTFLDADPPPPMQTPWMQTPPVQAPWMQVPWMQTPQMQNPPWIQTPPAMQTPPITSSRGHYATYWNAFLFKCRTSTTLDGTRSPECLRRNTHPTLTGLWIFSSQLVINHTTKMPQVPNEINSKVATRLLFLTVWCVSELGSHLVTDSV